ncbi:MAG: ParB N-terminal domain-containing protein [Candidatus Aadella gelida]|nr:ParB N-terminal domain-containing protein [Candidatus Aadella gelida]
MKIEKIPLEKINPWEGNPRKDLQPEDLEYKKIKRSIETFGCVEPLVWNAKTGNLVGGHQRYKILLEQGVEEIEVSVVKLSIEKEKALNLALNKIQGDWDNVKLATLLEELEQLPDFDIGLTGFDLPEISSLFDRYLPHDGEDDFDVKKEAETITEPVTQRGDIIELGSHRLLCGDSADLEDLEKLFQGGKADLVVTDPPYNVAYKNERPINKGGKR